jgi:hypothetical protein
VKEEKCFDLHSPLPQPHPHLAGQGEHSTTHVALGTGAAIGNHMLATRQGRQTFAACESTEVCRPRVGLVRDAFILMSRRRGITKCPKACMGVPGAIANERGERRSSCFWALQIGCAGRVSHSKGAVCSSIIISEEHTRPAPSPIIK